MLEKKYRNDLADARWSDVTTPPCEKFNCHMQEHCNQNYTACDAFVVYIRKDRSIDPRCRLKTCKGNFSVNGGTVEIYPIIHVSRENYIAAHTPTKYEGGNPEIFERLL